MIFKGELSKYHPADALMFLSQLSLNGVLSVSHETGMLSLSFKDGFLVDAHSSRGDEKLLRCLRFQKHLDSDQYERIKKIQSETAMQTRQILGELQIFPLSQVKEILTTAINEVLLELFLLSNGTFLFTDMSVDQDSADIKLDTGVLSIRILSQADEYRDFEKSIITMDRGLEVGLPLPSANGISTVERTVLQLAPRVPSVRRLLDQAPFYSYSVMKAIEKQIAEDRIRLSPVTDSSPPAETGLVFDPLFASYKQALKSLVRADEVLKKLEAVISYSKHHYDGILIFTAKNKRIMHCKIIRMDQSHGIHQQSIKKDLGSFEQDPVFSAVQRSGIGFFGKIFPSDLISHLVSLPTAGECALLPIINKTQVAIFFYAYTASQYDGLSPHHYLELLSWMVSSGSPAPQNEFSTARDLPAQMKDPMPIDGHAGADTEDSISLDPTALIEKIDDLPPLPSLASRSLSLLSDPETSIDEVETVIAQDQALVAKIIKVSNSALYGGLNKVVSLRQALARLGAKTTKSLVLASSTRGYFLNQGKGMKVWGELLWQHAVECGLAARRIAAAIHYEDPELAFIGGIMHDVGKVIILFLFPEKYKLIQKLKNAEKLSDAGAEIQVIQTNHAEIGPLLMGKWKMPEAIQACTQYHHDAAEAGEYQRLVSIVAYANYLGHIHGAHPQTENAMDSDEVSKLIEVLGLSDKARQDLIESVELDFQNAELMAE